MRAYRQEENEMKKETKTLEELKQLVYELGIDEAYENPSITAEELLDYWYDYDGSYDIEVKGDE